MTQANQSDLFGEGTYGNQQAPRLSPEEEARRRDQRAIAAAKTAEANRLRSANLAARGRQNLIGSGQKTATSAPIQWGLRPMTSAQLEAKARGASQAADKRSGGFAGDLARLGLSGARVATNPINAVVGDYLPESAQAAIAGPGYTSDALMDEAGDQLIPGGSGAYGANVIPGVAGTGGDRLRASERAGGGSVGGYVGGLFTSPTYAPAAGGAAGAGTAAQSRNGATNLSTEAQRVIDMAAGFGTQNQSRANDAYAQAAAAGNRAAPQMAMPSSANQQAVYDRAMNFNAQSGADAIRAERADISGAGRLENMQMDMQGVNNLEGFQNTQSQQGVNALYGFRPEETFRSAAELAAWQANNTAEGANAVAGFRPSQVQADAQSLRNFKADRSGIDRLNSYADEAQGPSAAQAMLRSQADQDKRTMLAISRSGRGGPAGAVQAQRQALTEGGLIAAETRGQGAALAAQETEAYKGRQLQALAQAGSLIGQAEAQRLQALSNAGALMSQADQQKLAALTAYGQLKATQDAQQLSAKQSSGQLNSNAEGMLLNATSNAAQLQGDMDSRSLSAIGQAAGLRTQQDSIRSNNLQAAGNIRLSGSEINQRGAIAASNADLQAQALNLQSLSLAGQVSSDIRNQDIQVLRSNLDASLQTMGLNDNQVRFFSQMGQDREIANQNLQMQAGNLGINANQAQQALDQQWQQLAMSQLSQQQQLQYQYDVLNNQNSRANQDRIIGLGAAGLSAISNLFPGRGGGGGGSGSGGYIAPLQQVPNFQLSMPQSNTYQNVSGGSGGPAPTNLQLTMPTYQSPYQSTPPQVTY